MSIIENGKKIAGNYKIQLAPEASTENAGVIKIATDQDIQDGTSEKLAVTPKQLNSYVSKDDISEVAKTGSYNDLIDVPEQYSLPIASTVELGGVKVDGDTINIDESGIISANIPDVDTSQFVQKSGDTMTGVLNFKNTSSDKIRMTQGDYTAILHQNGESLYFLLTNQGDQDGSYNDLRPFSIVLSDGRLRGNHTLSMPSNYWVNLTLGASNSNYTAPANGYFIVAGNAGTSGGYVDMRNSSAGGLGILSTSSNANHGLRSFVPAKKGDVVNIGYSSSFGSSSKYLTFVYAEGST